MKTERMREKDNSVDHVLVCLSASPSNAKIVRTAAKMASAFGGSFTALYVQTQASDKADEESKKRLQYHIRLAEQLGATIITVHGEDVSFQIAEYARISGVTKLVIGRSNAKRRHFWSKPTLTEKLTELAPELDIYIIPDNSVRGRYREKSRFILDGLRIYPKDFLIMVFILAATTLVGMLFTRLGFTEANIITVYILGVLLTSLFTRGYSCGLIGSFMSVVLFNFFLIEPRLTLRAYDSGYLVTFAIMLAASVMTGTLASKLKVHAKLSAQAAFRTKVLLDTNQMLQRAGNEEEIIHITACQLVKLLSRSVVVYREQEGALSEGIYFPAEPEEEEAGVIASEKEVAEWVYKNKHRAGALTKNFGEARYLYLAIRINTTVYGVIGIQIEGKALDSSQNDMVLSVLGECALALENSRNAKEKESAAVLAKNEQLRSNLLRTISHDLRTPLTTISGNAGNLLANYEKLEEAEKRQIFTDILDDSQWLIGLVENLLSVTRIEEGKMRFNMSMQLMDEVIEEALRHVNRKGSERKISFVCKDELLLARMDARLIMQVIINLVENAVKYTPREAEIWVEAEKKDGYVRVSVIDNGNGIPDDVKPHVFEMFYTGENKVADSRRSLGLGLPLCRSIVCAHGGEIILKDHMPKGCVFTFTLPSGEVSINE